MTHDEIKLELSSYALGALDEDERRLVEQHLVDGCPDCSRELASWREVVGNLALAAGEERTPDLKPRLLEEVGTARTARIVPLGRRVALPLALAAGALLAISFGLASRWHQEALDGQTLVSSLRRELTEKQNQMQQITETLAAKEKDLSALKATLAQTNEALAVIQRPGLQMVRLKQTPDAQPAEGHVLLSAQSHRALFYAFDLPQVPAGKAYELWWITEKQGPVMAGVFMPDQRGLGRVETNLPDDAGFIQAAAVTIEPNGGVPKPTGPMVLLGKL